MNENDGYEESKTDYINWLIYCEEEAIMSEKELDLATLEISIEDKRREIEKLEKELALLERDFDEIVNS